MSKFNYDPNHFMNSYPNIEDNQNLRYPQIKAYNEVYKYFVDEQKKNAAIIILPTGVGKTGLMGLLPYRISKGRVLIITPQLVIKDAVIDSLDPSYPDNFWLKRKIFTSPNQLPNLIEYEGSDTTQEVLEVSNFVVLNIHKLQARLESSLIHRVKPDFFDMIIIDEAHHSTANTWVNVVNYFDYAKIIKLTGTPYRTDKEPIEGDLVYKYKLSAAMANGFVKSLENIEYIPNELYLTIDNDDSRTYTVDQIYEMGIKDEDWVSRSVAYSQECSLKVVQQSISLMNKKLSDGNKVPHKIIAVACSIEHAEEIQLLYESQNIKSTIIHSKLDKNIISERLKDIENHRVQVVIHVAKLGEGYDHPYLSIAAIFRPFRSELPYAQFIGRILRIIPEDEATRPDDNIGQIVSHKHLFLDRLWNYYKEEMNESEIIKYIKDIDDSFEEESEGEQRTQDRSVGDAYEIGDGILKADTYLATKLLEEREKRLKEEREKIAELQRVLPNISEDQARSIIYQTEGVNSALKRPDQYIKRISKDIDLRIKEDIVPEIIQRFNIQKENDNLKNCRLFWGNNSWIKKRAKDNAALLAIYFYTSLKNMLGKNKALWESTDYEIAESKLNELYEYVVQNIDDYLQRT